jgi:protein-glutamine gamma-glutamyltransferase
LRIRDWRPPPGGGVGRVSATAQAGVMDAPGRRASPATSPEAFSADRPRVRIATFAALGLYGVLRWATLLTPAPGWRLFGLFLLAMALVLAGPRLRPLGAPVAVLAVVAAVLVAFALAGVPVAWIVHLRVAVTADAIGRGLSALPGVLVPYNGINPTVRLVTVLGAAVLLLDAAVVLAFAPRALGDVRRAAAALPLIALAVVPSTLVRPQLPYLQGLVLFGLVTAFMWGERVRRYAVGSAFTLAVLAGIAAMIAAPSLDQHKPWLDYRAWTNTFAPATVDVFNWNQTYGPLNWPRSGHEVLEVRAKQPDYWKAENLDVFNGSGWAEGPVTTGAQLPPPATSAAASWTQQLTVTIQGMKTTDVIAAGSASEPRSLPGGVLPGISAGTWTAGQQLGPGSSYQVRAYSPRPTAAQLSHDSGDYPDPALADYRLIDLPKTTLSLGPPPEIRFPPFHSGLPVESVIGAYGVHAAAVVAQSPYGGAFALARELASKATTPYAFVTSVERYLSVANGFSYNQSPPISNYPLESFLFTDKIGYCQQFSGAMALLLRMGGLPARVASGFTSGTYDKATHEWVVSDRDAHAWVEVWFPHYGWVRFDPTPASAPARAQNAALPLLPTLAAPRKPVTQAARRDTAPTPVHTGATHSSGASHGGGVPVLAIAAGLVVVALVLAAIVWLARLMRFQPTEERLVAELERALARCGRPVSDGVTLASLEHRFRFSPAAADYIRAIRLARFGGQHELPTPAQRRAFRAQLSLGLGTIGRLRALWALPPRRTPGTKPVGRPLQSD